MQPFIPSRLEFFLFSSLVFGVMSLAVLGISILRSVGLVSVFLAIMFVVPLVRRMLARPVIRD